MEENKKVRKALPFQNMPEKRSKDILLKHFFHQYTKKNPFLVQ